MGHASDARNPEVTLNYHSDIEICLIHKAVTADHAKQSP